MKSFTVLKISVLVLLNYRKRMQVVKIEFCIRQIINLNVKIYRDLK